MTDGRSYSAVQPLTRVSKKGETYVRPAAVEQEIEAALDLPLNEAFRLAAGGHTRPQTLVYFLRRFRPNRPTPEYNALVLAFFTRLERAGKRHLQPFPEHMRERATEWVTTKVFEWLEDDRMDIFEVSFKTGVERLYLTAVAAIQLRMGTELSQEDLREADSDETGDEAADALAYRLGQSPMSAAEAKAQLASVMKLMRPEERLAIGYVVLLGMTEKEAAAEMGCSDRKVRYLLKDARAKARDKELKK